MSATTTVGRVAEAGAEQLGPDATAEQVLAWTAETFGERFIVASNMQDAVLVDLAAQARPGVDVLFLDTGYHFAETIGTRDAVEAVYDVRIVNARPEQTVAEQDALLGKRPVRPRPEPVLRAAQGGAAAADAGRLRRLGHRGAPGGGADPGEHPAGHLRREVRAGQGQPDRRRGPTRTWTPTSPSTTCWSTRWSPRGTRASAARRARPSRRRARTSAAAAGPAPARSSAGCTDDAPRCREPLDALDALESESIHIFREVAGEFDRPVILFSGGKDSTLLVHLAVKAFAPAAVPFPLLHVDTGHNYPEVLDFRDRLVDRLGLRLEVAHVQDWIDDGRLVERADGTRNPLQTMPLLDTINDEPLRRGVRRRAPRRGAGPGQGADHQRCATRSAGGTRARQRPELWNLYNGRHAAGEHVRVFPISNWTELDVWRYIKRERIELPSIYYAHRREVFRRDGMWLAEGPWGGPRGRETCSG